MYANEHITNPAHPIAQALPVASAAALTELTSASRTAEVWWNETIAPRFATVGIPLGTEDLAEWPDGLPREWVEDAGRCEMLLHLLAALDYLPDPTAPVSLATLARAWQRWQADYVAERAAPLPTLCWTTPDLAAAGPPTSPAHQWRALQAAATFEGEVRFLSAPPPTGDGLPQRLACARWRAFGLSPARPMPDWPGAAAVPTAVWLSRLGDLPALTLLLLSSLTHLLVALPGGWLALVDEDDSAPPAIALRAFLLRFLCLRLWTLGYLPDPPDKLARPAAALVAAWPTFASETAATGVEAAWLRHLPGCPPALYLPGLLRCWRDQLDRPVAALERLALDAQLRQLDHPRHAGLWQALGDFRQRHLPPSAAPRWLSPTLLAPPARCFYHGWRAIFGAFAWLGRIAASWLAGLRRALALGLSWLTQVVRYLKHSARSAIAAAGAALTAFRQWLGQLPVLTGPASALLWRPDGDLAQLLPAHPSPALLDRHGQRLRQWTDGLHRTLALAIAVIELVRAAASFSWLWLVWSLPALFQTITSLAAPPEADAHAAT